MTRSATLLVKLAFELLPKHKLNTIYTLARQKYFNTLTGDTRKIFVSNIKTVDESNSARVLILIGCKPIIYTAKKAQARQKKTLARQKKTL